MGKEQGTEGAELAWSPRAAFDALEAAGGRTVAISVAGGVATALSGEDMAGLVRGAAAALREAGIGTGDTVAIWAPNSAEWVAAGLACHLLGVILAPLDAMVSGEEAAEQARESEARAIWVNEAQAPAIGTEIPAIFLDRIEPSAAELPEIGYSADMPIALFRTSGTTGKPKMFHLTLQNIGWNVRTVALSGEVSSRDRVFQPLPMHHVFPWITATLTCLTLGATLVLPESTSGPHIAEAMKLARPTIVIGVPRLYEALLAGIRARLRSAGRWGLAAYEALLWLSMRLRRATGGRFGPVLLAPIRRRAAPDLRMLISGGAHLPASVEEELEALGWDVRSGYGLAETSASITVPLGGKRLGSAGRAVEGCDIRIDQPDAEGIGEILLKGPVVFSGYLNNPEANATAFAEDGYFRSGDLGRLDEDGFLYVTGRAKELIVLSGGDNLFPEDVEQHYLVHPEIAEVGVMERDGALVAVVVPDMAEIAKHDVLNPEKAVKIALATTAKEMPSTWRLTGFVLSHEPLPRTRLLKLRRFLLPGIYDELMAGHVAAPVTAPGPEDEAWLAAAPRARLWRLLAEQYPDRPLSLDGYISYDLGLDSFSWMNLSLAIEQATGVRLGAAEIGEIKTTRDLLTLVSERFGERAEARPDQAAVIAQEAELWLRPRTPRERLLGGLLFWLNAAGMRVVFGLRVEGREHFEGLADRPFLICPNHSSNLDVFAVTAAVPPGLRRKLSWSGSRARAFTNRMRRALARLFGVFPIDEADPLVATGMAIEALRLGRAVVWFPEGWLTPDGRLLPFQEGVGHIIERSGALVVPAVIEGSFEAWPRDRRFARPHPVRVCFGAPIPAEALAEGLPDSGDRARAIAARLRERLVALAREADADILGPEDRA